MDIQSAVLRLLDDVLSLKGRALAFDRNVGLLGSLPELDSMAVVGIINAIEEQFEVTIADDEIDGSAFETVGALVDFVSAKVAG